MSRFDEHLDRDLGAIAERMTPSPDAWAEIQQRIADRGPNRETEIIMLVENTTTPRRWPLIAAAAAVVAVVVGSIALAARSGDDTEVPAEQPDPPATEAPVDDAASPIEADETGTVDEDAGEADPGTEAASATESVAPLSLELQGTLSADLEFSAPDADGRGTYTGTEIWSGDGVVIDVEVVEGVYAGTSPTDLDGSASTILRAAVDGVGAGTMSAEIEWTQRGDTIDTVGTVTGGTGPFEGATGEFTMLGNLADDEPGTWQLALSVPAEGVDPAFRAPTVTTVTLTGEAVGVARFSKPDENGNGTFTLTSEYRGDVVGTDYAYGENGWNDDQDGLAASSRRIIDATIDGVGSGTLVVEETWTSRFTGATEGTGTIVGGTGDFAGASGTVTTSGPDGTNDPATPEVETSVTYEIELTVRTPAPSNAGETVELSGSFAGVFEVIPAEVEGDPGTYTVIDVISGDIEGSGRAWGTSAFNATADGLDAEGRRILDARVDGVGSGLLVLDEQWQSKFTGSTEGTSVVLGGTGAFTGVTGVLTTVGPDGSNDPDTEQVETAADYTAELVLP